jgi:peptidoglycan/xylan/chitin deacetylase (PgdA/CDA1 family)
MFKYLIHFILFGSILATTYACKEPKRGTVFLTFDDSAVDDWYALADSLRDIDYKATYYVTNYHMLGDEQKQKLLQLQQRGHLIAHHSYSHPRMDTLADRPFEAYINEQIKPLNKLLEADGFTPPPPTFCLSLRH